MALVGTDQNDLLQDLDGSQDEIQGLAGDDVLESSDRGGTYMDGGEGDDYIDSYGYQDYLVGGEGIDIFAIGVGYNAVIGDFSGFDDIIGIDINGILDVGGYGEVELTEEYLVYGRRPKPTSNEPVFLFNTKKKTLTLDADGKGSDRPYTVAKFVGSVPSPDDLLDSVVFFDGEFGNPLWDNFYF